MRNPTLMTLSGLGDTAVVNWVRPGVNGYGVGLVVQGGSWQGEDVQTGDTVAIPPGVTTAQAPQRPGLDANSATRPGAPASSIGRTLVFAGAALFLFMYLTGGKKKRR